MAAEDRPSFYTALVDQITQGAKTDVRNAAVEGLDKYFADKALPLIPVDTRQSRQRGRTGGISTGTYFHLRDLAIGALGTEISRRKYVTGAQSAVPLAELALNVATRQFTEVTQVYLGSEPKKDGQLDAPLTGDRLDITLRAARYHIILAEEVRSMTDEPSDKIPPHVGALLSRGAALIHEYRDRALELFGEDGINEIEAAKKSDHRSGTTVALLR